MECKMGVWKFLWVVVFWFDEYKRNTLDNISVDPPWRSKSLHHFLQQLKINKSQNTVPLKHSLAADKTLEKSAWQLPSSGTREDSSPVTSVSSPKHFSNICVILREFYIESFDMRWRILRKCNMLLPQKKKNLASRLSSCAVLSIED